MIELLQIGSLLLVAIAMALSLAHALELPGKRHLSEREYLAIQRIYYPGFTIGGGAEPLAVILLVALSFLMPAGPPFWLTVAALMTLAAAHAAYWLLTHPVNNFWLKETELSKVGSKFFGSDPLGYGSGALTDWQALRDRWEWSHVVRAVLSLVSFGLLATAIALT